MTKRERKRRERALALGDPLPVSLARPSVQPRKPQRARVRNPDVLTAKEVAEVYRCSPRTVRAWAETGRVTLHRYRLEDVVRFLQQTRR